MAVVASRLQPTPLVEIVSGSPSKSRLFRQGVLASVIKRFCQIGIAAATVGLAGSGPSPVLYAQGGCTTDHCDVAWRKRRSARRHRGVGDGRYLAFASTAANLVAGDTNGVLDVFVFDRTTCAVERVSVSSAQAQGNFGSVFPAISRDGRFVAFLSSATNLGPTADTNGAPDVFVRDRLNGVTQLVSSALNGGWGNNSANESGPLAISGNGQFVAFWSDASNLVSGDTNGVTDLFVRDLNGGTTTRVSVATGGVQATGTELIGQVLMIPAISDDGRYVAFSSTKADLVPGDSNGVSDVFRYDRQTSVTVRVSVSSSGSELAAHSFRPAMSRDGNLVVFDTAGVAVPGDSNASFDVYLRNVVAGTTTLVSPVSHGGISNGHSILPTISGDGRYVAFMGFGTNVVVGDTADFSDLYIYDRNTGITRRISSSAGGVPGNGNSEAPHLSDDGAFVSFESARHQSRPRRP
jgi:Tol biopolymer transport system component